MTRFRTYTHILISTACAFVLAACVANPNQTGSNQYGATSENAQTSTTAPQTSRS